jgi:hypothetical protein
LVINQNYVKMHGQQNIKVVFVVKVNIQFFLSSVKKHTGKQTGKLEVNFRDSFTKVKKKVSDFNPGPADSHQIQIRQETTRDLWISPDAVVKTELSVLSRN